MVSIEDLKSVRNSCLHRDAHFVKLHFATIANLGKYLLLTHDVVVPVMQVAILALQCDDYEYVAQMLTIIGHGMFAARSVPTCDMFISLVSHLVKHANATSILSAAPSSAPRCTETHMRLSCTTVLSVIGIAQFDQIARFVQCTTAMFKYILMEGHSGDDIIATLGKTGILVGDIHAFVMHSCDLVLDYVINRSEEVVALQKRMCMARTAMVNILTFGGETTFRIMLCLTQEEWTASLAIQTLLSAPRQFGAAISTAEGDGSSMMELMRYGNAVAVQTLLKNPEKIATAMAIFAAHSANGFRESSMIVVLTHGNTLAIQTLIESPEKIATAMAIFATHKLSDARRIQLLLAHGGVTAITAFIEEPQEFAEALETLASDFGFRESSMIVIFTHGNTLALQTLIKNPDKIATAMAIFATHNLADTRSIQLLLAHGGVAAITAFIEEPQQFAEALKTLASNLGFIQSSMIVIFTNGNTLALKTFIKNPEKIATAMAIFATHKLAEVAGSSCCSPTAGWLRSRRLSRNRKSLPRHWRHWPRILDSESRR